MQPAARSPFHRLVLLFLPERADLKCLGFFVLSRSGISRAMSLSADNTHCTNALIGMFVLLLSVMWGLRGYSIHNAMHNVYTWDPLVEPYSGQRWDEQCHIQKRSSALVISVL